MLRVSTYAIISIQLVGFQVFHSRLKVDVDLALPPLHFTSLLGHVQEEIEPYMVFLFPRFLEPQLGLVFAANTLTPGSANRLAEPVHKLSESEIRNT